MTAFWAREIQKNHGKQAANSSFSMKIDPHALEKSL